ncbi:hypothetical protein TorRG33x02_114830 [Trema orientale]|uniref:Uncharacterized protein n=1 Tax=Trema orientale TaxID=63057 RepID=A0A2P5F4A3_TREOI|nr:hypothetical protein TorRG33x02_114830 [Trema orientale]
MEEVLDSQRGFAVGNHFYEVQPNETYSYESELKWLPPEMKKWKLLAKKVDGAKPSFEREDKGYVRKAKIVRDLFWKPMNPIEFPSMVIYGHGNAEDKDEWHVKKFWGCKCCILRSM